jgi:hypothetical protein
MIQRFQTHIKKHKKEVLKSIKLIDIEERFDLAFSRFFGLYLARFFSKRNMTPTQVSLWSLFIGVIGGGFLYFQNSWQITLFASILITIAGVLDSADGQLARLTNQGTELGRIIDGTIDNFVFLACYFFACTYFFFGDIGWPIVVMGLSAGFVSHTLSSAIYDFYKSDFLFYVGGFRDYKIPTVEEVKNKKFEDTLVKKFLHLIYIHYTKNQYFLYTRTSEERQLLEKNAFNSDTREKFKSLYREKFSPLMFWWALIGGTNTHRTLIMAFSIAGRFDLYLIVCLLKLLPLFIMVMVQKKTDNRFIELISAD